MLNFQKLVSLAVLVVKKKFFALVTIFLTTILFLLAYSDQTKYLFCLFETSPKFEFILATPAQKLYYIYFQLFSYF